jgi:predicted  nucleic acid-binding Zn-ribbon protein
LPVEPGKSEKLVIRENLSGVTKVFLSTLTDEQITAFLQEGEIQPSTAQALRKITAKKFEISSVDQEIKARQQELEAIDRDQSRLRENMKALKGSPEEKALLQRYTKQLDAQEDRVATLQNEIATLKTQRLRLNSELETMVQQLTLDETI